MWLDRLGQSGAGSPQNSSRSGTPLPQRPGGAGRAPYMTSQRPARGSNLSLVSNDSTTSLLASRRQNGSSLRQSTSASVLVDNKAQDAAALALLGKLIGVTAADAPAQEGPEVAAVITNADLEFEFDFGGLSLRELAWDSPAVGSDTLHRARSSDERMWHGRGYLLLSSDVLFCGAV